MFLTNIKGLQVKERGKIFFNIFYFKNLQKLNYVVYLHRNKAQLVYGVMVTLLFLVQSFKVRVLVDQQKSLSEMRGFPFL